jgi:TonB family protein
MPHALLLSPDDQAVSAITGVLEEMSVTCERPLDGVSAAQKLNSQTFDLVLVDCENLPAAKLIFDVCRRGKNGNNPVPIAIVDGRAGLPTAFRLGAELILTKPVAKDQARSTIRTAVSRVRKDAQTNESVPAQPASADVDNAVISGSGMPGAVISSSVVSSAVMPGADKSADISEERAQAAVATAVSSQLTSFAEPAPSFVPTIVPAAALTATLSAPALIKEMHSAIDEIDATPAPPKLNPRSESFPASPLSESSLSESSLSESSLSESSLSESSPDRAASAESKPVRPLKPSDDPVLAELERTELEESKVEGSELKGSRSERSILESSILESSRPSKEAPNQPTARSSGPVLSLRQGPQKRRGALVAVLMLVLAGGGFYALWTYQPGFRDLAQPQIDRVLALAGMALPPTPAPNPTKSSVQLAPATTTALAPVSPADPNQNQTHSKAPDSATGSATGSATAPATASPTSSPTSDSTAAGPVVSKPEPTKLADSKKDADAATPSETQLPGENSATILSSKGAEKRLAQSVPPKYPVEARLAQGTVVLKAVVDANGKVEGLRLVEGNAILATAAIQAVKQWRYRPYVRDGKAQAFQTVVIVDFQRP